MTVENTASAFLGRTVECAQLEGLLLTAGAGQGAAVVVRGPAGIGKTAVLDHVTTTVVGRRVVRLRGVAAEADLPYSMLNLLCAALPGPLRRLEPDRREALDLAAGLRPGAAPDRSRVGVALLELLGLACEALPLICVVDDAQWLDRASAQVLSFVARRLGSVPVALLFAERGCDLSGLPELVLGRLGHADSRRLLGSALTAPLDDAVIERIVTEARGHPAALLDSARERACELAGGYGLVASHGAAAQPRLAAASEMLLLLAAAEPLGDPARLWRAAARLGIAVDAAEQLESENLLVFGRRVAFRDPRLRPLVYGAASAARRRLVHGALAAATDPVAEPDRRVWHLAHALVEPDDALGDELSRCAVTAQGRGGLPAAAAFLERAALFTADPARRAERAVVAADAHHAAGATETAERLLAMAELGSVDAVCRARLDRLRARIGFDATRGSATVAPLLRSAQALEASAPRLASEAHLEAMGAAISVDHLEAVRMAWERLTEQQLGAVDVLLGGLSLRCADGHAAAVESLKLALKKLDGDGDGDGTDDTRSRLLACIVAPDLWDDDRWHELTSAEVRRTRETGARTLLPYALTYRALADVHMGQFAAALSNVNEARAVTDTAGIPPFTHAAVVLAAWRGREDRGLEVIAQSRQDAYDRGEGFAVAMTRYAEAVLYNGLGRYRDAITVTRQAIERDELGLLGWSLVELVEAAVRGGEPGTAALAVERLSELTCLSGTDWALGVDARSRALLHDGGGAEALYIEAIERLGRTRVATHLARTQLVYGEWLRRQGRRVDARVPLRTARQSFVAMGAEAFAERAHRELLATGERVRRRVVDTRGHLTPQEARIALLARDGRSTPTIATQLSISPRTVEYHLRKVFAKLAITSRTELHLVLSDVATQ